MSALFMNRTFMIPAAAWFIAQMIKAIVDYTVYGSFDKRRLLTGSGGMPSSHASTVTALAVVALIEYGLASFQFSICFFFAFIVMYDAMGVRLETGKQAKLLNAIVDELFSGREGIDVFGEHLKELVGHTPLQVICGSLLGAVIALVMEFLVYGV